jgi:hypothetical protein
MAKRVIGSVENYYRGPVVVAKLASPVQQVIGEHEPGHHSNAISNFWASVILDFPLLFLAVEKTRHRKCQRRTIASGLDDVRSERRCDRAV